MTTAVFGNCGVGFAPVRPGSAPYLINLMEGVEDIPGTVLAEGVTSIWESFPDYLEALAAAPKFWISAHRCRTARCASTSWATAAPITPRFRPTTRSRSMGGLLEQSLAAGALGFTTSRTIKHKAKDGRFTPSLSAPNPSCSGSPPAMKRAGRGVIEVNSDFGPGEFEVLRAAAEVAGRPLSLLLLQVEHAPELWRETLAKIHARAQGGLECEWPGRLAVRSA